MSTEKMREQFLEWWRHEDQRELRCSCAEGWARHVWYSSRAAIAVQLRDAYMKGWEASGEGWNHEYPGMTHETERWQRERDQVLGLEVNPC